MEREYGDNSRMENHKLYNVNTNSPSPQRNHHSIAFYTALNGRRRGRCRRIRLIITQVSPPHSDSLAVAYRPVKIMFIIKMWRKKNQIK